MKVCSVVLDGEFEVHAGEVVFGYWSWVFKMFCPLNLVLCTLCFVIRVTSCYCLLLLLLPSVLPASYCFLLPGLIACSPLLHSSHNEGSTEGTVSVARAVRGTPTSAAPEERSIIDAAPTTVAPAR